MRTPLPLFLVQYDSGDESDHSWQEGVALVRATDAEEAEALVRAEMADPDATDDARAMAAVNIHEVRRVAEDELARPTARVIDSMSW